jgi:hypothetical protein
MKRTKTFMASMAATMFGLLLMPMIAGAIPVPITSTTTNITVRPSNPQGWGFINDNNQGGSGSFVSGPATPPIGFGSAQLTTNTTLDGQILAKAGYQGVKLSTFKSLKYSSFQSTTNISNITAIALQFNIDKDVTDANNSYQGRIVYEPYNNTAGTVPLGTWNQWDAINSGNAKWWFSNSTVFGTGCAQANPCTISHILALYPNIGINSVYGAVIFKAGSGWTTPFKGSVDKLIVGTALDTTTYNFEQDLTYPTSKEDCKNDKWKTFTGVEFKNQGQCIKYVEDHYGPAEIEGTLTMSGPSQKIKFHVDGENDKKKENTIEYWNYEYPGGLHYVANVLCSSEDKTTNEARVMFQIPAGHPGLSNLYVVVYVKDMEKKAKDLYGHSATSDLATATTWCKTGAGFAPTLYPVVKGSIELN